MSKTQFKPKPLILSNNNMKNLKDNPKSNNRTKSLYLRQPNGKNGDTFLKVFIMNSMKMVKDYLNAVMAIHFLGPKECQCKSKQKQVVWDNFVKKICFFIIFLCF